MAKFSSFFNALTGKDSVPFYDVGVRDAEARQAVLGELERILCMTEPEELLGLVATFEQEFAARIGAAFAIGLNSGTSALYFALRALGVGAGDEVVTVGNTFVTTISAILQTGATPVFADLHRATGMMDASSVSQVLSRKTKAIIPVHMYGNMADMEALTALARTYDIAVVEDACQAIGSRLQDRYAGTWGDIGCFSFHANKLVGAQGDAGMLVTRRKGAREQVRKYAEPGWEHVLDQVQHNVPSRLAALLVPVLRAKLECLEATIEHRSAQYERYREGLANQEHVRLLEPGYQVRASHRNIIAVAENSTATVRRLGFGGVPYRRIYPGSSIILREIVKQGRSLPETEHLIKHHISLPVGDHIDNGILDQTIEMLRKR